MCPANSNQNKDECEKRGRILCRTFLRPATQAITLDATNFSWAVSGFGQSHEMKYCVTDVKSQYQGILTDIGQGSQSGGTYPYLIKQDFFHLRVVTPKQLTAAILLLVCNDMRFFSFFPRIIKVSVRPGSYIAFLPCRIQFEQNIMKQIISLSIVLIAFDTAEMRRMNRA